MEDALLVYEAAETQAPRRARSRVRGRGWPGPGVQGARDVA